MSPEVTPLSQSWDWDPAIFPPELTQLQGSLCGGVLPLQWSPGPRCLAAEGRGQGRGAACQPSPLYPGARGSLSLSPYF